MTKQIEDYTVDELSAKINAIKAERERTANALKRYEEELERRKQEVPLGVPLPDKDGAPFIGVYELGFSSEKSFYTFSERFQNYVTATRDNAKGEPIDIQVLLPLLKKGWVAYEKEYGWVWFNNKPFILMGTEEDKTWSSKGSFGIIGGFKLKPAENWEESLQECGL